MPHARLLTRPLALARPLATAITARTLATIPRPRHREANMVAIAVAITNKHLPRHNGGTLEIISVEVEVEAAEAPSRALARWWWRWWLNVCMCVCLCAFAH